MEDYEIIEADFHQFYHLNVDSISFYKFARLLLQLPSESRFIRKHTPSQDWTWDKEIQSRILMQLDAISCQLTNMAKKKGAVKAKPGKQMQPDYVEQAKKEYQAKRQQERKMSPEDLADLAEFWRRRNPGAKLLGGGKNVD